MFRKIVYIIAMTALTFPVAVAREEEGDEHKFYLVSLRSKSELSDGPCRLSPALRAVKDSGGVLKGSDESGKPVIAVLPKNTEKLQASKVVVSLADPPKEWESVKRLKVSYKERLTPDDLKASGLKLVEDYQKGSFMIVEPLSGRIDARLAEKLESCEKIRYAAPSLRIKAIPSAP